MVRTERVPCSLDVALGPLLKGEKIVLAVLEVLQDFLLVAVEESRHRCPAWLLAGRPRAVLDVGRDVVGSGVGVGDIDVHVVGTSWRVEWVEGVHASLIRNQ